MPDVPTEGSASPTSIGRFSIDLAIREAVRDVVREEVRLVVREEIARLQQAPSRSEGEPYLSVADAARLIHVHPATIRAWIRSGRLGGHHAGRHLRIRRSELEAYVSSRRESGDIDLDARAAALAAA